MTAIMASSSEKRTLPKYITAFLIVILLCHSREVSVGIFSGMNFAVRCLIPTLFPFFIICDMIFAFGLPFDTLLKKSGAYIIIIGLICGFPHGARCATRLFEDGKIDLAEYERLLILSNCPSIAFVVSGIGAGMMGNITYGLVLFTALILSTVTLCVLKRQRVTCRQKTTPASRDFNLVESIKNAGASSITIASFIIFFYGLHALIGIFVKNEILLSLLAVFLEIGTGSLKVATDMGIPLLTKMTLLGFTVGFSSLSVFMQCSAFISDSVNKNKLFIFKLLQGLLAAFYAFLLTFIYKKWLF